jgi:hypothetical protein
MSERTPEVRVWYSAVIPASLPPEAMAAWESAVARLATLTARVAALVPLAKLGLRDSGYQTPEQDASALAALAAIAAEQTTTTTEEGK